MKHLETKHWVIIGAMLVAIGTQLGGLEHGWVDAKSPAFISGLLIQIGTTIAALFVGAPQKPYDGVDRRVP
jgi:hypothetical protein